MPAGLRSLLRTFPVLFIKSLLMPGFTDFVFVARCLGIVPLLWSRMPLAYSNSLVLLPGVFLNVTLLARSLPLPLLQKSAQALLFLEGFSIGPPTHASFQAPCPLHSVPATSPSTHTVPAAQALSNFHLRWHGSGIISTRRPSLALLVWAWGPV